MTTPGKFNLSEAALKKAQDDLDQAAQQVQQTFKNLEEAVLNNPSKGDAFTAAQRVASELTQQANKFNQYANQLAENVGISARNYQSNSDSGVQSFGTVSGNVQNLQTSTLSRLSPGA
ncbi:WXG100 family type VII secretion target [Rugosimonospora africana]|uniref:WXG100 family type VII secretion target n=1 Tax=Rugosimonospora africana TaxID=556532 RepID=A0A8J3R3X9_9ACTN|nr:hypothetical protein [Rugosimonospora africana]GIH21032.1 hypothetical protein Raf01_92040 [Rugosimonospora africana]